MDLKASLRDIIIKKVFVSGDTEWIAGGAGEPIRWVFDFRSVVLDPAVLDTYASLVLEYLGDDASNVQVGGIEIAAVPLVAGIVQKSVALGTPVHGFFIRKSRKKYDRVRAIEGTLIPGKRIVLVDDVLNSGGSIKKQIEMLRAEGHAVSDVVCILRFRDLSQYAFLEKEGVRLHCLFELNDFSDALPVSNYTKEQAPPLKFPFHVLWRFASPGANFEYVNPKSAPAIDAERLYFGADSGAFWCVDQRDGRAIWKFQVPFGDHGKMIFSSPAVRDDLVVFGAYDGCVYGLDARTGARKWVFWQADWVGSSPEIAGDLGLVFIGLEFGLIRARGGLAALDHATGKKRWFQSMPGLTAASPSYSKAHGVVICGCNDGAVYAFDASTGEPLWSVRTKAEVKGKAAIDEERGLFAVGSFDGHVYVGSIRTGALVATFEVRAGIYSTPLFVGDLLYVASLDRRLYCFNVREKKTTWHTDLAARIFASPIMVDHRLYIGSNRGAFCQIDPLTGSLHGILQLSERIVNAAAYNDATRTFFIPTDAGEIYAARLLPPPNSE